MQNDLIDDQGSDKEDDSLFGSPPPSPIRGRSPVLALPSGKQNVGTIALPGSHIYSELPVNPLASSVSPAFEQAHRPPAQYIRDQVHIPACTPSRAPSISTTNSQPPTRVLSVARKQKAKEREKKSTPRPTPPPIPLPDPDAPPPINFLRNQQALLGTAGLVGGVNPATLSVQRHTRGSTSSNPIVVDDELNPPPLGFKNRLIPPVDPALLPTPSNEQIVASLIKQKNIFPVLESILKLVAAGNSQNTSPFMRSTQRPGRSENESPPGKKRKLDSVPAGAADWDVPYPFSAGEGPQAYRTNWERDRGKQLIAQLVGLIKSAMRTASTKAYLQQQHMSRRPTGSNRPVTETSVSPNPPEVLADHSNGNITQPSPDNVRLASSSGCQRSTPFDQIVASILAPQEPSSISEVQAADLSIPEVTNPSSASPPFVDQGLFDNWMSILNASPTPEEGTPQPPHITPTSTIGSNSPLQSSESFNVLDINTSPAHNPVPDFAIDPALLAISVPQAQSSLSNPAVDVTLPGSLPSPMASTSSVTDPFTPNWEATFPEPEIFPVNPVEDVMSQLNSSTVTPKPAPLPVETPVHRLPPSPAPSLTSAAGPSTTAISALATPPARPAANKPLDKEDTLRRARERKRQLSAEIARAKVELWEATIEQGVLAQLVKDNM